MSTTTDAIVTVRRDIAAPPAASVRRLARPGGSRDLPVRNSRTATIVRCDIDARVGGRLLIVDRRAEGEAEHHGQFTEIHRPAPARCSVPRSANRGRRMVEGHGRYRAERDRLDRSR